MPSPPAPFPPWRHGREPSRQATTELRQRRGRAGTCLRAIESSLAPQAPPQPGGLLNLFELAVILRRKIAHEALPAGREISDAVNHRPPRELALLLLNQPHDVLHRVRTRTLSNCCRLTVRHKEDGVRLHPECLVQGQVCSGPAMLLFLLCVLRICAEVDHRR